MRIQPGCTRKEVSKTLIILLGPHAVGKMTVGQELEKLTNLRLFHNHMSVELALKLFEYGDPGWNLLNQTIRSTVFDLFAKGDYPGLIFTYMCAFDQQSEFEYLQNIIDLFESNDANCYVIELCADFEERIQRNKSENRLAHKESKRDTLRSEREMRATNDKYRLNSLNGEELPFKNFLKIDNTNLSPHDVAKTIITHFDITKIGDSNDI